MARDSRPVKFIRKGGRIIPIFKSKKSRESAALLAGGVGTTTAGALIAGSLKKKADFSAARARAIKQNVDAMGSFRQLNLFSKAGVIAPRGGAGRRLSNANEAMDKAFKDLGKANFKKKLSFGTFKKSRLLSAAIVGLGVTKGLEASGFENSAIGQQLGSEFIGVGAAAINDSIGNRLFRKKALNESLRKGFKKDIFKAKSSLKGIAVKLAKRRIGL